MKRNGVGSVIATVLTLALLLPLWLLEFSLRLLAGCSAHAAENIGWVGANVIPGWLFAKWAANTKNRDVARIAALRSDSPKTKDQP